MTVLHTPAAGSRPACAAAVVTAAGRETGALVRRLTTVGLPVGPVVGWGSVRGYAHLLDCAPALVVLDLTAAPAGRTAERLVRACALLGPLAVLAPAGFDPVPALEAGALDVLDRDAPETELAARLCADMRGRPRRSPPDGLPGSAAQSLLLRVLAAAGQPVCCHELCWLLGRSARPLPLPALKMRMLRLQPLLPERGLVLRATAGYSQVAYRLLPACDESGPAREERHR